MTERRGDYKDRGEYHRELDPNWSYAPIYRRKIEWVDRFVARLPENARLLDVGAGEGHLVERYNQRGYRVIGVDPNFTSDSVRRGSALALPFEDDSFDAVLCLDVLEHLALLDHTQALLEIGRVLTGEGRLLLSLPNLAHLHSRINFMLRGRLTRTSAIERHPGDRPVGEYMELLSGAGFDLVSNRGIFPTVPIFFRMINRHPAELGWMVAVLDRVLPIPSFCFLVIIETRRKTVATAI